VSGILGERVQVRKGRSWYYIVLFLHKNSRILSKISFQKPAFLGESAVRPCSYRSSNHLIPHSSFVNSLIAPHLNTNLNTVWVQTVQPVISNGLGFDGLQTTKNCSTRQVKPPMAAGSVAAEVLPSCPSLQRVRGTPRRTSPQG
jgi:hypothetical protein